MFLICTGEFWITLHCKGEKEREREREREKNSNTTTDVDSGAQIIIVSLNNIEKTFDSRWEKSTWTRTGQINFSLPGEINCNEPWNTSTLRFVDWKSSLNPVTPRVNSTFAVKRVSSLVTFLITVRSERTKRSDTEGLARKRKAITLAVIHCLSFSRLTRPRHANVLLNLCTVGYGTEMYVYFLLLTHVTLYNVSYNNRSTYRTRSIVKIPEARCASDSARD